MSIYQSAKFNHRKGVPKGKKSQIKGFWQATLAAGQRGREADQTDEQQTKVESSSGNFDPFKIPILMNPTKSREDILVERYMALEKDKTSKAIKKLTKAEQIIVDNCMKKEADAIKSDIKKIESQGFNAKPETIEGKIRLLFMICKMFMEKGLYDNLYMTFNKINEYIIPQHISEEYSELIEKIQIKIEELDRIELQFTKFHTNMPPLNEHGFVQLDPFQKDVIKNIDMNKSTIVLAPTSAGKSILTSYLYTKKDINGNPPKVLVVVPTDPLAWQMAALVGKTTGFDIPLITRTFQSDTDREGLIKKIKSHGIVVGTPQYLVDFLPLIDITFDWVVIDEIHMIGKDSCKEMEVILKTYTYAPTLALSATIGNVDMLREWFMKVGHKEVDIIRCDKRFFNLQKFYYDSMNENPMVRIHPLSTVSIEDIISGDILKKSLNLTPPDIWDIAKEFEKQLPAKIKILNYFSQDQRITLDQANEYFNIIMKYMVDNISKKKAFVENIIKKYKHEGLDCKEYDIYDVAMTLKKNDKTPALVFQTDSHLCLELVRKFSKRIHDEEEKAHPNLLKERLKLHAHSKAESKKLGMNVEVHVKDRKKGEKEGESGAKKKVNIKMDSIGDKKMSKLMMSGELEKMEEKVMNVAFYEPHPDFIMNKTQVFSSAKMDQWNKELKRFFPQNGSEYHYIIDLLWRGVGVYSKGLPDPYLHIIQNLACSGQLGLVFSDDSLVFGVSMPFRTTVITPDHNINSMMFHQMAGRAGRRGLDKEGNVIMVGYSWSQIQELTTSIIPDVNGCDTMFYGASFASKMSQDIRWDNIKSNFLLEKITNEDAIEFYTSIKDAMEDGWSFANSDNISFNHMLWRFRHSDDAFRVAFLLTFIRKIYKGCNPKNENTQIEFAKFMSNYIDIIEVTEEHISDGHILGASESASKYPIRHHMEQLGLDIPEKIDSKVFESIQRNRIINTLNRREKSILRERIFNFGEKIKNIQHYFFHCNEIEIACLLSKLITRIWWIYHTSSPVMDAIERYDCEPELYEEKYDSMSDNDNDSMSEDEVDEEDE
jgi:hypothetical protein